LRWAEQAHDIPHNTGSFEDQLRGMVDRDPLTMPTTADPFTTFWKPKSTGSVAPGDRVLVAITELVREELRGLDRLARYSGEEFLIIAPNTTGQRALTLAERLRSRIATASFDTVARVTCSFGVCEYNGDEDADALVRRADDLMYRARRSGRSGLSAE
jgi:diguanylate cyclase (GGDEF)-like protein